MKKTKAVDLLEGISMAFVPKDFAKYWHAS